VYVIHDDRMSYFTLEKQLKGRKMEDIEGTLL
jgi:hypothetical protein